MTNFENSKNQSTDYYHPDYYKPTLFCDIDGTIIENQSEFGEKKYGTKPIALQSNIDSIKNALVKGCQVIFITARSSKFEKITREMLNDLGFENCKLIMDLHHSKRILINDFTVTNPYPSAVAINLQRNTDNLHYYLEHWIENL